MTLIRAKYSITSAMPTLKSKQTLFHVLAMGTLLDMLRNLLFPLFSFIFFYSSFSCFALVCGFSSNSGKIVKLGKHKRFLCLAKYKRQHIYLVCIVTFFSFSCCASSSIDSSLLGVAGISSSVFEFSSCLKSSPPRST